MYIVAFDDVKCAEIDNNNSDTVIAFYIPLEITPASVNASDYGAIKHSNSFTEIKLIHNRGTILQQQTANNGIKQW